MWKYMGIYARLSFGIWEYITYINDGDGGWDTDGSGLQWGTVGIHMPFSLSLVFFYCITRISCTSPAGLLYLYHCWIAWLPRGVVWEDPSISSIESSNFPGFPSIFTIFPMVPSHQKKTPSWAGFHRGTQPGLQRSSPVKDLGVLDGLLLICKTWGPQWDH